MLNGSKWLLTESGEKATIHLPQILFLNLLFDCFPHWRDLTVQWKLRKTSLH